MEDTVRAQRRKTRVFGVLSVLHSLIYRLGKEKSQRQANGEYDRAHDAASKRIMVRCGLRTKKRREDVCGKESCGGADHPTADVRRETAAGAAQVQWKSFRQVLAKVTELRDNQETADKNARAERA